MKDLKILFISGNWTDDGGRPSKYMTKIINSIVNKVGHPIDSYNGGTLGELDDILKAKCPDSDVVFWFPNIPTSAGVQLNPKNYNHKIILVNYKRNDANKLRFDELMSIAISVRSDLTCEIHKNDQGKYEMRIFDILGTQWSDFTTNTSKSIASILGRIEVLKTLKYQQLHCVNRSIPTQNPNINDIIDTFTEFGKMLADITGANKSIKRHLGELSFRGYIDPTNRTNDIIYASERNLSFGNIDESKFIATKLLNGKTTYYSEGGKPHLDVSIFNKLMSRVPEVNFIFHSHCYIDNAPFTERCLPTGCINEFDEVIKVVESNGLVKDFCINMIGHGSLIMTSDLDHAKEFFKNLIVRELPEPIGTDYELVEVDDGVQSFISTLKGRPIQNNEPLEIRFTDDSVGNYPAVVKYYTDEDHRVHKDAYIKIVVKGIPTELPINGLYARRI